ncbi:MAG: winged helix DNA-binding domain-containing protein [Gemmatimonadota bacterium]
MMDRRDLAHQRLANQRISKPTFERPADVVDCLCAVQSQDFAGAKWAVGLRMRSASDADVEKAFNDGSILRTHLLRPTWHFVRPADIRWLLDLTAPRIKALLAYRHRRLELDARTLKRTNAALGKALRDGVELTRDELRDVLRAAGITSVGVERMTHIMGWAELDGIVCSGPRRGKQFTYALLDARAPRARALDRDEALAELAKRYFQSRGPATVQDLAKWSGLTVADARIGLEEVKQKLRQEVVEGRTYWLPRGSRPPASASPTAYLLSIYDEYISGYKDRSAIVEPEHGAKLVGMGNALTSVIVLDGQIVGTWKRRLKSMGMAVETNFFDRPTKAGKQAVATAARRYGRFLGLPVTLR